MDKLIGAVPIVGSVLLGEDENLLSTWFRLDGPWRSPQAHMMPPAALSAAANMITGSIRRVLQLLPLPGRSGDEEQATPDENAQ